VHLLTDVVLSRLVIGAKILRVDLSHLFLDVTDTLLLHPKNFKSTVGDKWSNAVE